MLLHATVRRFHGTGPGQTREQLTVPAKEGL